MSASLNTVGNREAAPMTAEFNIGMIQSQGQHHYHLTPTRTLLQTNPTSSVSCLPASAAGNHREMTLPCFHLPNGSCVQLRRSNFLLEP